MKEGKWRPTLGNVVTWLQEVDRSTPAGLCNEYSTLARICLNDARILDKHWEGGATPSEYILIAHALELALKAFLAKRGLIEEQLRKAYGHNLDSLYCKAVEFRLDLSSIPEVKDVIERINHYHCEGEPIRYALRYDASTRTLPEGATLFRIIEALLQAAAA